jgi:two-component system chemotaxis response regulator CheB
MERAIRVVVVDDSPIMRQVIADLLQRDQGIQVVGLASNGREALKQVQDLRPDVVIMDVLMPVMDGLTATEQLMAYQPTPILALTSIDPVETDITFKMLGAGALEVMTKPSGGTPQGLERSAQELIRRVKLLSRVRVVTHLRGRRRVGDTPPPPAVVTPVNLPAPRPRSQHRAPLADGLFPLVVIGASTGGPRVVARILADLPPDFPAAVVVVQHIATGFTNVMVDWLGNNTRLPVQLATHGFQLRPGVVLVAPDEHDLRFGPTAVIRLSEPANRLQVPEIDGVMMSAAGFGVRTIGVLLTGMGRDGAAGMFAIHRSEGYTIAQDEASSAIFGMPKAAIDLGAVDEVLPAPQIGLRLVEVVQSLMRVGVRL